MTLIVTNHLEAESITNLDLRKIAVRILALIVMLAMYDNFAWTLGGKAINLPIVGKLKIFK